MFKNVPQIKLFFYGSRITVLTFSLLSFYFKNTEDLHRIKLFGTGAVQPVYYELLQTQAIFLREPYNRFNFFFTT